MKEELINARIESLNEKITKITEGIIPKYKKSIQKKQKEIEDFKTKGKLPKSVQENEYDYMVNHNGQESADESVIHSVEYDIDSLEESIKDNNRKLAELKESLAKYQRMLKAEQARTDVPDIKEIHDFIDDFEEKVYDWCVYCVNRYNKVFEESLDEDEKKFQEECGEIGYNSRKLNEMLVGDEYEAHKNKIKDIIRNYSYIPNWLLKICGYKGKSIHTYLAKQDLNEYRWSNAKVEYEYFMREINESELRKFLDEDNKAKYIMFIREILPITGRNITSTKFLEVSEKGDINGIVTGDEGTAKVLTFSAGGYNIQCYHYRTRITKLR